MTDRSPPPPPRGAIKARATAAQVPQSRDDCAAQLRVLGDLQREYLRAKTVLNDAVAAVTAQHQPQLSAMEDRMEMLRAGIQTWCEAHRVDLCGPDDRLGKTAHFVTGDVSWRTRPPSVTVRNAEGVIEALLVMGLSRMVRTKREVNREALLAEPDVARTVPGVTIVTGQEDFIVVPLEATPLEIAP